MTVRQPQDRGDFAAEPRSVDLRDYWLIVRRRWVLVLVLALIGAIGGLGYAKAEGPTYSATSQVVVMPLTQGPLNPPPQVNLQVNMSTEQAVAQSPLVVAQASRLLRVQPAVLQADAAKRLTVSVPANTLTTSDVLQITWQAKGAQAAEAGADAFAQAYLAVRHRQLAGQIASLQATLSAQAAALEKQIARFTTQLSKTSAGSPAHQNLTIRLNELTAQATTVGGQLASLPTYNDSGGTYIGAARPVTPSGLSNKVIIIIGVVLGLLIGLILAFVRDSFDDRVRDPAQLERKLGGSTLAVLASADSASRGSRAGSGRGHVPAIATAASPDGRAAEAVRALRATLVAVAARRDLRTLLVAGADVSVSSSRIAAELGVALAESGRRVLVMAADMRGSSLPQIFDLPGTTGLSDLLTDGGDPRALTRQPRQAGGVTLPGAVARRLAVLPGGPPPAHALSVLDSGAMIDLLQSEREDYEFVLLDSPPATMAADVFSLAAHVDGVIVLAREARTRGRTVEELRRRLDQVGALLVGGVLISKGNAGRHRSRGPQPVASPSSAAAIRRPAGPQEDRRPQPTATQQRPAVGDNEAARPSGGLTKRPL
jgi:Mrp family chromosome partitioning ATPase/capsular polysaccharide biosynthesis protein